MAAAHPSVAVRPIAWKLLALPLYISCSAAIDCGNVRSWLGNTVLRRATQSVKMVGVLTGGRHTLLFNRCCTCKGAWKEVTFADR